MIVRDTRRLFVLPVLAIVLGLAGLGIQASPAGAHTYEVRPGDTLSEIARDHSVTVSELMSANGITNPNRVRSGQRLTIPGEPTPRTYVIQPGDSLGIIARDHGVSMAALSSANGITNPHRIVAGRTLTIPSGGSAARPTTTATNGTYPSLPAVLDRYPERRELIPVFERWAAANNLPVDLLMAVAWQESGWNNAAVSSAGAIGIGQLMPPTSAWVASDLIGQPGLDPLVPEDNIRMSARFLRWLTVYLGSEEAALAGYFQGPGSVRAGGMLDSTVGYVASVQALRASFVQN